MTSYTVSATGQEIASGSVGITAGSLEIRISSIDIWSSTSAEWIKFYRQSGGSMSGGTLRPPTALRADAPPALTTARIGSVSFTGTQYLCWEWLLPLGDTYDSASQTYSYPGTKAEFTPPLPFTIAPGGVLQITGFAPWYSGQTSARMGINIYFEELLLQGSF